MKAYTYYLLNSSKGVVRSSDLSLCTLDEIKTNLYKQNINDAQRISIKKNNQTILTNIFLVLTPQNLLLQ